MIVTLPSLQEKGQQPIERPKYVDDGYDWEEGLLNKKEEELYNVVPKLWHVGEVAPKKL